MAARPVIHVIRHAFQPPDRDVFDNAASREGFRIWLHARLKSIDYKENGEFFMIPGESSGVIACVNAVNGRKKSFKIARL
ncbi:MAG: hypothetical protein LBS49_07210 [Candidatus Accumulibacter sp.]|jgi:hypothetical protein|nr:hypothetical protein [Accumulibacter sp.]